MFVRNSVLFCFVFLTDKNDRFSQLSEQGGCGSRDGRKKKIRWNYIIAHVMYALLRIIFEIYYHYPARASKVEIIYCFIEFQVSHAVGSVTFDFSLIFVGTLLTSCRHICLKSPLPPFQIPGYVTGLNDTIK